MDKDKEIKQIAEEFSNWTDRRKPFGPPQMYAGPTHTKSANRDGYFEDFKRLYEDGDRPLWKDKRKEKMRYERTFINGKMINGPFYSTFSHKKRSTCNDWYGAFGPKLESVDPRVKEVTKKEPEKRNFYTNKHVKNEPFPTYIEDPYEEKYIVGKSKDTKSRPVYANIGKNNSYFDRNPYKTDDTEIKKIYKEYHEPYDSTNHKFGVYNNYGPQNKAKIDPANCFNKYPEHMEEKFVDKWRQESFPGYIKPRDSANEKYGPYNNYATQNHDKMDPKDCFNKYPEHMKDKYVEKWRIEKMMSRSHRINRK
ncbi:hypothetical protein M8J76_012649 [Diaphorina citri]|nr:hypothetical protein M8J76_012649 [Diaphorina citri]KAI5754081.1 hypothetical protein M8J77_005533 [Diaphorina citri]